VICMSESRAPNCLAKQRGPRHFLAVRHGAAEFRGVVNVWWTDWAKISIVA
jgi:hypothetical protein